MTISEFKDLASAIQSLLVGIALLIGGIWALYRFRSLREAARAEAELKSKERGLRDTVLLNVTLDTEVTSGESNPSRFVVLTAKVTNPGNEPEIIDWSASDLNVYPVVTGANGQARFGPKLAAALDLPGNRERISSSIAPQEATSFTFALPVSPGFYRAEISLSVTISNAEIQRVHHKAGMPVHTLRYEAAKFFEV